MPGDLEFFEKLRQHVGDEAARLITRRTESEDLQPLRSDVQTLKGDVETLKDDVRELKGDVETLKDNVHELKGDVGELKGDVHRLEVGLTNKIHDAHVSTQRWMLTLHTSQLVAMAGLIVAIFIKG